MPIPFKLDYAVERATVEPAREQYLIKKLTGVKLSAEEARAVWPRVQDHKWYVSERLGRDVGLRVAAVDYFENIWTKDAPRSPKSKPAAFLVHWLKTNKQPLTLGA
ncbi:MAG: adenylate cyclase [Blastocatellia bacterium]|jgi:hypothetical protein|nr:adenylate cyclase [Blastocatellia bacterium]